MKNHTRILLAAVAAVFLTVSASSAFADGVGSVAKAKEQTRLMSVTFSPAHLFMPIYEITAEFKAHDRWGVAGVGGWGSITATSEAIGEQTFSVWEAGGQLRYYVLGNFDHGMQLGAEALYMNVSHEGVETSQGKVRAEGEGVSIGPFIGYKIATDIGFTFDSQLGVQRVGIGAEAEHTESGESASDESEHWGVLLNLNIGWSF